MPSKSDAVPIVILSLSYDKFSPSIISSSKKPKEISFLQISFTPSALEVIIKVYSFESIL